METKQQVLTELARSHCLTDSTNVTRSEKSTERQKRKTNFFGKKDGKKLKKEIRNTVQHLNKLEDEVNMRLNEHDQAIGMIN